MNPFLMKTVVVGPLQCNCQIIVCAETHQAVIVDPGDDADRILNEIKKIENELKQSVQIKMLLHTHAHFDHFAATAAVHKALQQQMGGKPTICLHQDDAFLYEKLIEQGNLFGFHFSAPQPVDRFIADNEEWAVGNLKFCALHTPGHSPGGLCFRLKENSQRSVPETLFSGDTLFRESVGRSDLWGGDEKILKKSIQERIYTLDEATPVWPGHGLATEIGYEKRHNPFVNGK